MMPARIGMVVHAYYLRDARVIRYAEALAQAGHEVTVLCLQEPDEPAVEQVNGVTIHRVRFERRRGGKIWYMLEYVWAFVLFAVRLSRLEFARHFDIIHVHNMPDFLVFAGLIPRLRGARLILDLHDPMPELFMSKYDLQRGTLIHLLQIEERLSCAFAHHLITVDQSFKDIFAGRGIPPAKFTIVRNMPDDRFFAPPPPGENPHSRPGRFVLIFAGTVAERYHLHDVIRAVAIARQQVPHILFSVVGKLEKEGDYTQRLQELVQELDLHDAVEFRPPVPLDQMPQLFRAADVGLEPSRHDPYTDYVLPLKLLECVAVGTPCLVSRRPTIESYFTDEDVAYFDPGDVEGLAARMVELARSPEKCAHLAVSARRIFDRYNWATEKRTYLELLFGADNH